MTDKQSSDRDNIEPGMTVEATEGDLGEQDVSKPKITDVVHDAQGNVEKVEVTKGVLFKKRLEIPADRVQQVKQSDNGASHEGKVSIDASKKETASLKATGEESLAPETQNDLLDKIELQFPTSEGLREKEYGNLQTTQPTAPKKRNFFLHIIGPGFIGGMSGNDASAVTAYAVDGATAGYGHLWLMLLSTFMYQSVQYSCAKIGRITQEGLAGLLRKHYGRQADSLSRVLAHPCQCRVGCG